MKNTGTLKVEPRGDTDIVMSRVFDASRRFVYQALTDPELVPRWYGPREWKMTVCEIDLRVGGAWRFVTHLDGQDVAFHGEYREIETDARLVQTEIYEDQPDEESLVTSTLDEADGRTTLTLVARYSSAVVRDMVLATGMEHGAAESYDRMAEVLASLVS
jgi:uncharacterized protein YndB with AHSA1/START domain